MKYQAASRRGKSDQVTLGEGWRQFAMPRDDLEYLGVIRRGMEIGALAKDQSGAYLQVNGDMRQTLNSSRIESLLRAAKPAAPKFYARPAPPSDKPPVVVVIKKRRIVPSM